MARVVAMAAAVVVNAAPAAAVVAAQQAAAMVAAIPVTAVAAVLEEAPVPLTRVSHVKTPVTARVAASHRARRSRRATVTSSNARTHAVPATIQGASHAMTLTTSNPPATPPQASRHRASPPAATEAASAGATAPVAVAAAARVAVVAGATGLVGQAVLALLLADKRYSAVHAVGRRAPGVQHAKLVSHVSKTFGDVNLPAVDDVFIALGTTIKLAGSQAAFKAVDFDAVLAVAQAAHAAGASRLGVVSAMGADSQSSVFYNRVKGDMEAAVGALGFTHVLIARPALLLGDRAALNQPQRAGEGLAAKILPWLSPLLPANYKPVDAAQVARALVGTLATSQRAVQVMLSGDISKYR